MSYFSILRNIAGPILASKAGDLLGKGISGLVNKGRDWLNRVSDSKIGQTASKWIGSDTFKKAFSAIGVPLADKAFNRMIGVLPGGSVGASMRDGLQQGYNKMMGNLTGNGNGGNLNDGGTV